MEMESKVAEIPGELLGEVEEETLALGLHSWRLEVENYQMTMVYLVEVEAILMSQMMAVIVEQVMTPR